MQTCLSVEKAQQLAQRLHNEENPDWESFRFEEQVHEVGE